MTSAVLTPFSADAAVELAAQTWRKKLLPIGSIDYKGRTLKFTRDYLSGLVDAFRGNAYDQVAFQLADSANTHTNDPDRFRGEVAGMELGDDGLYVTVRTTEAGGKVLEANPKLGVSARIVEDYARSDGQFFKTAVQHVLGTLDPRIPGLGAWEAIEAASPVPDTVVDLTAESFTDLTAPPPDKAARKAAKAGRKAAKAAEKQADPASDPAGADPEGGAEMADLTKEQKARLDRFLALPDDVLSALEAGGTVVTPAELEALTAPGETGTDPDDAEAEELAAQIAAMTDDDLAALEAEFEAGTEAPAPEPEREPVAAGMSAEAQFAIDLANAKADETARELAVVTARLREEDFQGEKRRLADAGVPPYITELARPLLEGAGHAVELSNGKTVDAGAIMRRVLSEYARQARLLDLDVELGSPRDEPEDAGREEAEASRAQYVAGFKNMTGLK
jgi:hypothetical protein